MNTNLSENKNGIIKDLAATVTLTAKRLRFILFDNIPVVNNLEYPSACFIARDNRFAASVVNVSPSRPSELLP